MKKIIYIVGVITLILSFSVNAFAAWNDEEKLVAHALGQVDGKIETNSKEAFIASWGNGFRVMEADFCYTSDDVLVVRHDFDSSAALRLEQSNAQAYVMDSTEYKESKIIYEQTPMMAVDLFQLMKQYSDVYLITDTKYTDKATVQKEFKELRDIAYNMGSPEILDRIIPQIYSKEMLGWVKDIYNFQDWIYTFYLDGNPNYSDIADFCFKNNVGTVTIEKAQITKDVINIFHSKKIKVYTHTVNRYQQAENMFKDGVDGIYTDSIKPYELPWIGLSSTRKIEVKTYVINKKEINLDTIELLGETYTPLRQLSRVGKGFNAVYDSSNKKLSLTGGPMFTGLGNELLLNGDKKLIAKKADFDLFYNGVKTDIIPILVDNEVYVSLEKMTKLMGVSF